MEFFKILGFKILQEVYINFAHTRRSSMAPFPTAHKLHESQLRTLLHPKTIKQAPS